MKARSLNKHTFLFKQAKLISKHIYDFKKENNWLKTNVPHLIESDIPVNLDNDCSEFMNPIFYSRKSWEISNSGLKFIKSRNRRKFNRSINPPKNIFSTTDQRVDKSTAWADDSKISLEGSFWATSKPSNIYPANSFRFASSVRSSSGEKDLNFFKNIKMQDLKHQQLTLNKV